MVLLVLDGPQIDPKSRVAETLHKLDRVVSSIFFVEALLRIGAVGFVSSSVPGQKAYIKSGANKIDFFVSVVVDVTLIVADRLEV